MAIFKLIEEPDIVVAYIAIKIPFKNGEEIDPSKKLALLNKVKHHINEEIKLVNCEIEKELLRQSKQINIEDVIKAEEEKN